MTWLPLGFTIIMLLLLTLQTNFSKEDKKTLFEKPNEIQLMKKMHESI